MEHPRQDDNSGHQEVQGQASPIASASRRFIKARDWTIFTFGFSIFIVLGGKGVVQHLNKGTVGRFIEDLVVNGDLLIILLCIGVELLFVGFLERKTLRDTTRSGPALSALVAGMLGACFMLVVCGVAKNDKPFTYTLSALCFLIGAVGAVLVKHLMIE